MRNMLRVFNLILAGCCMLFINTIYANASDDRVGTVVDGSLLVDGNEVESSSIPDFARGTYLASGSGKLSVLRTHYVQVSGSTTCNRTSDEVKVTLHLQKLSGNTWVTVYTLGPKTATNTTYVSNSRNYTITGGYYYRVSGSHSAKKGSTTEVTASYTNGLWID